MANITSEKTANSLKVTYKDMFEEEDRENEIISEKIWERISDTNKEVGKLAASVKKPPF